MSTNRSIAARFAVVGLLAVGVALSPPGTLAASSATQTAAATSGPGADERRIVFGAVGGQVPDSGENFRATERLAGRALRAIRLYATWDDAWPDAASRWARSQPTAVLLSVKAQRRSGFISYRSIAAARPGTSRYREMVRWAQRVRAFGAPMYFTFNHEPEARASDRSGSAAEFIAAWRRVRSVFRAHDVRNAKFLFIATAYGFSRDDERRASRFYPGDAYVDEIGVDGYNWYTCRSTGEDVEWRSLRQILDSARRFAARHGKPLIVAEFGSAEDHANPGRKAQWFRDAQALFKTGDWRRVKAVLAFFSRSAHDSPCNMRFDTSPSALQAFRAWAADPYYAAVPPR